MFAVAIIVDVVVDIVVDVVVVTVVVVTVVVVVDVEIVGILTSCHSIGEAEGFFVRCRFDAISVSL